MSSAVEGGAALAWRLLATLEGGSLLLATSALLAYAVSHKIACQSRARRSIRHVLVTNTTNLLGRELKRRLEERGCVVETPGQLSGDVTGAAGPGARVGSSDKVDAIVVVGAEHKAEGLDGMAGLVTEDVHNNLRLLECVSPRLHEGGFIAWACARGEVPTGAFSDAGAAFDTVLHANLVHIAKLRQCEAIWVGRRRGAALAAEQTLDALFATSRPSPRAFSVRMSHLGIGRWWTLYLHVRALRTLEELMILKQIFIIYMQETSPSRQLSNKERISYLDRRRWSGRPYTWTCFKNTRRADGPQTDLHNFYSRIIAISSDFK